MRRFATGIVLCYNSDLSNNIKLKTQKTEQYRYKQVTPRGLGRETKL